MFNGILWILRTGAPWADLPDRYPSYQTCHRRFQQWVRSGVLRSIIEILAQGLLDEGYLDLQEAFIDGSFAPAKQGGALVGKTKRGKGSKIMAIADRQGSRSLFTSRAPRRMKSDWCTPRSLSGLSGSYRSVSSVTTPTSRTDWMLNWHAVAWV